MQRDIKTLQSHNETVCNEITPFPSRNSKKKTGWPTVFMHKLEEMLVEYCLETKNNFYGLTAGDLAEMALHLAMKNNLSHQFSMMTQEAGQKWSQLLLKRYCYEDTRRPENLSAA